MCEEFAIHLSSPSIPLPPFRLLAILASLRSFRSPPCPADPAFSFSLFIHTSPSPFPLSPSLYLFLSHIRAANFSSVLLLFIFFFYLSLSRPLSPLNPAPLLLARFISARCQFEFGTRATGQRVSTKNQFLNARLFRAEGPACIFPSLPSPPLFASSLCATAASIFFDGTLTPRDRKSVV